MTAAKTAPETAAARPPANADELKAAQAPLKAKYREQADSAVVTFRAEGRLDEGIACKVDTGRALVEAGLHPAAGGTGTQACSGDMLLEALAACTGVTLNAVATAIGFKFAGGRVVVEGDLDFRGTLGVDKEAPVGFRELRIAFDLDTEEPQERIDQLLKLTERFCVVLQTISKPPRITSGLLSKAAE